MDKTQIRYLLDKKPEEIIEYFKAKGIHPTWNWKDLWQESSMKAFTVTKVMEMDILQDIKNELVNALESGETLQTFKQNLESVLANKGWWKVKKTQTNPDTGETAEVELGSNRRMRQIFETNLTTSYRAGQYKQQWENRESRPWWMYVCKMLPTSREEHKALHGKVFRYDDPFWDSFYPPNGFNCRCDVIPLTEDEINKIEHYTLQPKLDKDGQPVVVNGIPQYERVKTKIERCQSDSSNLKYKDATATVNGRKMTYKKSVYIDPKTGVETSTDRGWNYNPGKATYYQPDLSKYDKQFVDAYLKMKAEFDKNMVFTKQVRAAEKYLFGNNGVLNSLIPEYISHIKSRNNQLTRLLNDKQGTAVYNYTIPEEENATIYYKTLNYNIKRGNGSFTEKQYELYLNDCLSKCPSFVGTTYRGQGKADEFLNMKIGDTYIPNKFLSSSKRRDKAAEFNQFGKDKVFMTIKAKNGKSIKDLSKLQIEDEVLFSSKTKFLVEDITKVEDGLGGWIVNMVISEL